MSKNFFFEEEGKGSIKNEYNEIYFYNSKYWKKEAIDWAKSKKKNILVQRAQKVWRVNPNGKIKDLNQSDYELINYT